MRGPNASGSVHTALRRTVARCWVLPQARSVPKRSSSNADAAADSSSNTGATTAATVVAGGPLVLTAKVIAAAVGLTSTGWAGYGLFRHYAENAAHSFDPQQSEVYEVSFRPHGFTPHHFKQLMAMARFRELEAGEFVYEQCAISESLALLVAGEARWCARYEEDLGGKPHLIKANHPEIWDSAHVHQLGTLPAGRFGGELWDRHRYDPEALARMREAFGDERRRWAVQ